MKAAIKIQKYFIVGLLGGKKFLNY